MIRALLHRVQNEKVLLSIEFRDEKNSAAQSSETKPLLHRVQKQNLCCTEFRNKKFCSTEFRLCSTEFVDKK